jgi:hypothetical protein
MNRTAFALIPSKALTLTALVGLAGAASAQTPAPSNPYPKMAPIAEYLMTEDAEVVLARSAAPKSITDDATIVVLKQHGYETVAKGKNGFVCIVERGFMSNWDFPEFWNPKMRDRSASIRPQCARCCPIPTSEPQ